MIWFFLCGMVAGAVGVVMVIQWWIHSHTKLVKADLSEEEMSILEKCINELKEKNAND